MCAQGADRPKSHHGCLFLCGVILLPQWVDTIESNHTLTSNRKVSRDKLTDRTQDSKFAVRTMQLVVCDPVDKSTAIAPKKRTLYLLKCSKNSAIGREKITSTLNRSKLLKCQKVSCISVECMHKNKQRTHAIQYKNARARSKWRKNQHYKK